MITAIIFMFCLGLTASFVLALASKIFHKEEDPKLEAIRAALPGVNCGGCGFPGCDGAAEAIFKGKAPLTVCICGGIDVVKALSQAVGIESGYLELKTPTIKCSGGYRNEQKFYYAGAANCRAAACLRGGSIDCHNACFGLGTCVAACMFNAISMGADGIPEIDVSKCRGCGRCAEACPNGVIRLDGLTDRLLHLNTTDECLAPCRQKCPAQINVPQFIRQIKNNKKAEALLIIKERNPFPMTVGRTCPHPCENICRRNIADESLAVLHLQRFLGDWEYQSGKHLPLPCADETGRKTAIIGGGPAGLSCAYFLRRLGHQPCIFELRSKLGGMMRYGIPAYRLPKKFVDWEIEGIINLGIEVRLNVKLGTDFTLKQLAESGFEAFFLGFGAWTTPSLCVPGEHAVGVLGSLDFLSGVGTSITDLKRQRVIVIGESNTAMDCARSSVRLGAASVTVICPCTQQDMSARKRDIVRTMEEGVTILFMTNPVRIYTDAADRVTDLEYCKLEPDKLSKGKKARLVPAPESQAMLAADLIIAAYERKPEMDCLMQNGEGESGFRFTSESTLDAEKETMLASSPNVFTAGDLHTGRASVISAVAGGRKAARSIHYLLTAGEFSLPENLQRKINPKSILKDIQTGAKGNRVAIRELPVALRCSSFVEEVVSTITEKEAIAECSRCLRCGDYCYDRE